MASNRTSRINEYQIRVDMNSKSNEVILDKEKVPYPQSRSYFDEITIKKSEIIIDAKRSTAIDMRGIFINYQSALFRQITKALIYYYCSVREPIKIRKITVQKSSPKENEKIELENSELTQVVRDSASLAILKKIDLSALKVIFSEDPKGHGYLHGLTFLIKSLHYDREHERFENEWKAFNALYKASSGKVRDFDCHVFIRKHMINHPDAYPLILSEIDSLSADDIRNNIRWIKFIHNDFPSSKHAMAFRDFVFRNEDHRLMKIISDTLTVREQFLKEKGLYTEVLAHLRSNIDTVNASQLAATLCIKYAYFARNKLIHAENIESGFRLVPLNKEENEIAWMSSLLALLIIDLINANGRF